MKKIFIILLTILLLTSCKSVEIKDTIISQKYNTIEYGEKIYLYDLLDIKDGVITTKNYVINSNKLGNKKIEIVYKNSEDKIMSYIFDVNIVDTTKPLIYHSKSYTTKKGKDIDILNKIMCGDNYDRNIKCTIEGDYDVNKTGEYLLKFTAKDVNNNYAESEFKLIVKDTLETNNNDEYYYLKDLINKYKNQSTMIGIDVSSWQGNIDWEKAKNDGIEFAIIRIGYGHDEGKMVTDKYFEKNLKEAKEAGLLVGLYFYSYAKTTSEAIEQADWIIDILNGQSLDLPISFDWESWSKIDDYNINFVDLNNIAFTFMKRIEDKGYEAMNYGSAKYLEGIWKTDMYPTWLAYYTNKNDFIEDFYIWQITNTGKVNGIEGYVDLNILYKN